ncbi:MAG TPA: helix-turn-helix domain-containing protein [Polyangia bacterium]|nr:helix-turn-helix domain-containing protein [Polyangia bacterium]
MSELLDPNDLLTPSDAARILGLSADSVRVLSDSGRLASMRTIGGRRLFRRVDVDRLALERSTGQVAAKPAAKPRLRAPLNVTAAPAPSMK